MDGGDLAVRAGEHAHEEPGEGVVVFGHKRDRGDHAVGDQRGGAGEIAEGRGPG